MGINQIPETNFHGAIYRGEKGIDALVDPWFDAESQLPFPIPPDPETSDVFYYALYNPDNGSMKYICYVELDGEDEPHIHEFALTDQDAALLKDGLEALCQKEHKCTLLDLWRKDSCDK